MSRTFKRLTFAFAALAIGLVGSVWVTMRVVATRIVEDKTAPVRQQLLADWEQNEARFVQALQATEVWANGAAATPPTTGCHLEWVPAGHAAVKAHLARCPAPSAPLDEALVSGLEKLGEQALAREAELPAFSLDFAWMATLRGLGDWSDAKGTPYEFVDARREPSVLDFPLLDVGATRRLAVLRLVAGQRAQALGDAVEDVTALGRALLGRPTLPEQLVGLAVLRHLRAQLDGAGQQGLGPAKDFVDDLALTRLAAAQLWHPWLPETQRERLLAKLPAASRCAAAGEAFLLAELGEPFTKSYPGHLEALHAWRGAACASAFVQQVHDARKAMPADGWRRVLGQAALLSGDGEWSTALVTRMVEHDGAARRAAVEIMLAVITPKPFPPATK